MRTDLYAAIITYGKIYLYQLGKITFLAMARSSDLLQPRDNGSGQAASSRNPQRLISRFHSRTFPCLSSYHACLPPV